MSHVFQQASDFITSSAACQKALESLKDGSSILLIIDKQDSVYLQKTKMKVEISDQRSQNYDIRLEISPDAFSTIVKDKDLDLAELGIRILKQVLMERIDVEVQSSLLKLIRNGYFKIAIVAGRPFLNFLSSYGMQHMGKIYAWVESKRKR